MSSITTTTSSTLYRPYIGSCHNRQYIPNKFSSPSLLSNNYYFSKISFLPYRFQKRNYLSNRRPIDVLQERVPIKYVSYPPISLDERRFHREKKAKDLLSSSFPTIVTYYDRSSSPFIEEQQHSHSQSSIYNHYIDRNESLDEENTFSSSHLLADTTPINNNNGNQFHRLPSFSSQHPPISDNIFPLLSSNNNNTSKFFPTTSNYIFDRSSTTSVVPTNLQHRLDIYQLNNMSSLRYPSSTTTTHSYDQRVSDQGNKYIIQLKTDDYQENEFTITPRSYQNQLIIDAKHTEEDSSGGYIRRELHKIFLIPKHIDLNKYQHSYNKNTQELTIEMPYLQSISHENKIDSSPQSLTFSYGNLNLTNGGHVLSTPNLQSDQHNNTSGISTGINNSTKPTPESSIGNTKPFDFDLFHQSAFQPEIRQTTSNEKKLHMSLDLTDYQPEDIKVTIKDQELIVKAERKTETDTRKSRTSFFQSTSLPPQTDIEHLQSNYIDGKLIIEAPYLDRRVHTNEQTVIELQQQSITDDPFEQRTETVIEFIRRRRL